jgi:hypothetical protein
MSTIRTSQIAHSELLIVVQRYDAPRIMFGFHEYQLGRHTNAPQLMGRSDAVQKIDAYLDARYEGEDWEEIDPVNIGQHDETFNWLVLRSLPIEFHADWLNQHPDMVNRVRAWSLADDDYQPAVPHCLKDLRFRDAAGLDGGGHISCLSETYSDGTCPKQALHHDVYIRTRDWTKCQPNSHVGSCKC